jgi:hypothetical protein
MSLDRCITCYAHLYDWDPKTRNCMSVPEAHSGGKEDGLFDSELVDDVVDVRFRKVRWRHSETIVLPWVTIAPCLSMWPATSARWDRRKSM